MDISGNGFAAVIPMAEEDSDWMGAECVITGWGRIARWDDPSQPRKCASAILHVP